MFEGVLNSLLLSDPAVVLLGIQLQHLFFISLMFQYVIYMSGFTILILWSSSSGTTVFEKLSVEDE